MENIKITSEATCINSGISHCTKKIAEIYNSNINVLDYGCGTGRNMWYLIGSKYNLHGCDTIAQLKKQKYNHDELREKGCVIETSKNLPNDFYNVVLCSFVLNVIESDDLKKEILKDLLDKQKRFGITYLEVRTKSDILKTKNKERYKDGFLVSKGKILTYQEPITFEKLENLVNSVGYHINTHICNTTKHYATLF